MERESSSVILQGIKLNVKELTSIIGSCLPTLLVQNFEMFGEHSLFCKEGI